MVHLGTNDILQGNQDPTAIRAELANLIGQLRAANPAIRVLLAQVIPVSRGNPTESNQIPVLNAQISTLLSTGASPVTIVDQFTGFSAGAPDLYDGVHPTDTGEQKIAAKWLPALKAAIQ